jgi:hypothetical protein
MGKEDEGGSEKPIANILTHSKKKSQSFELDNV